MSPKETVFQLLEKVPEYKMGYVIAYLQGLTADEEEDDAFCEQLCEEYEQDPEKGETVTMEEMLEMCGVKADEL